MVTVKIKENSKQAKVVIEMLKTFDFVDFVDGLSRPAPIKNNSKLMQDIETGFKQLKQKKEGKLKFNKLVLNGK
jgi:hypothetical protein